MKNLIKMTLVGFVSIMLFACDGGTTSKSNNTANETITDPNQGSGGSGETTVDPKTFTITVDVTAITSADITDKLVVDYNGEPLDFTTVGQKTFTMAVEENKGYTVTVVSSPALQTCLISNNGTMQSVTADVIVSVACSDNPLIGNAVVGKMYYMSECAVCHAAGEDDTTRTFGALGDLAQKFQKRALDRVGNPALSEDIQSDMHAIGPVTNLMGRFQAIPAQSIADLKQYLTDVCVPTANKVCPPL